METEKAEIQIKTLSEFWPFYLGEHQHPKNRLLHFIGSAGALYFLGKAVYEKKPALVALAALSGYGCSWLGHFFIEKNKPAAFKYPVKSLISDYRMFTLILAGKMQEEMKKVKSEG